MLPFLAFGILSTASIVMGNRFSDARAQRKEKTAHLRASTRVKILAHRIAEEKNRVLATEEVPMDNRFGNKLLSSEHEFSQTATVALELGDSRRIAAASKSTLWKILESKTEWEIGKNLGMEIGSQINRRVQLKFATDPGQFVRYRVIWQQQSRRGLFEIQAGKRIFQLPYMVAYGLTHTVESLPGEPPKVSPSTPKSPNHPEDHPDDTPAA